MTTAELRIFFSGRYMPFDGKVIEIIEEQLSLHSMNEAFIEKSIYYMEKNKVDVIYSESIPRLSESKLLQDMYFVLGNQEHLKKFRIGIVGTRKPDEYAVRTVTEIVKRYKNRDIATVSGFAEGIDSLVHKVSLDNSISTIAVLPCGFSNDYPVSNKNLKKRIIDNGLLLTEYSPYIKPLKLNFIQRNHVIAALSDILIITQGAMKSGTLSTFSHALKLNKQIFAIPGEISNKLSFAPNYAIFRGAIPIYSKDILPGISIKDKCKIKITEDERNVLELAKKYKNINDMVNAKEFPYAVLISVLTTLELKGLIVKGFNNKISVLED